MLATFKSSGSRLVMTSRRTVCEVRGSPGGRGTRGIVPSLTGLLGAVPRGDCCGDCCGDGIPHAASRFPCPLIWPNDLARGLGCGGGFVFGLAKYNGTCLAGAKTMSLLYPMLADIPGCSWAVFSPPLGRDALTTASGEGAAVVLLAVFTVAVAVAAVAGVSVGLVDSLLLPGRFSSILGVLGSLPNA